jgi:hypothetical protein
MPSVVSVVGSAVVDRGATIPIAIPAAVAPAAASAAHHGTDSDSGTESDNARGNDSASGRGRGICRDYIGVAIDDRWVVFRNIDDLGICRLDHDHLGRLRYHRYLGSSL